MKKTNVAKGSHEKRLKLNCPRSDSLPVDKNITTWFSNDVFQGIHPCVKHVTQWKRWDTEWDKNLKKKKSRCALELNSENMVHCWPYIKPTCLFYYMNGLCFKFAMNHKINHYFLL
jgi:hypothetical protein